MSAKLLRSKAERKLTSCLIEDGDESEPRPQLHELQVHQVELEMQKIELELQNEALIKANIQMNATLQRYTELYNFAPITYLTIQHKGNINEANHAATSLLRKGQELLCKMRFGIFVSETARPQFNVFLEKAFASPEKQSFETKLLVDGETLSVIMYARLNEQSPVLLLEIVNISEHKQA